MKIAFLYGWWSCGAKSFDFSNLYDDPQGLTGSELSCFEYARSMAARGHEVSIYTVIRGTPDRYVWHGCTVRPIDELPGDQAGFDVLYAWNEPDIYRRLAKGRNGQIRMVNQQVNDFAYCQPGYDNYVDLYTSPSATHRTYMVGISATDESKWAVMPNGCDPTQYGRVPKVPGRVIYASSPDRGLHWLLQCWPRIRRAVPDAHLRIFYNFDSWFQRMNGLFECPDIGLRECAERSVYIKGALNRLADQGVQHVKSVSRTQMADEFSQATVLGYPCDTIRWTEGFSVTTLEACASRTVPVITGVDALGTIYANGAVIVEHPVGQHLDTFSSAIIRSLTDPAYRNDVLERAERLARDHTWALLAGRLETVIYEAQEARGSARPAATEATA